MEELLDKFFPEEWMFSLAVVVIGFILIIVLVIWLLKQLWKLAEK